MSVDQEQETSQLFTLRIWMEEVGDGRGEVRGQLKHVLSGESSYFREWPDLLALLRQYLDLSSIPESNMNDAT